MIWACAVTNVSRMTLLKHSITRDKFMEAEEASELPYAIELDSSIAKSKLEPRIISASHY